MSHLLHRFLCIYFPYDRVYPNLKYNPTTITLPPPKKNKTPTHTHTQTHWDLELKEVILLKKIFKQN